MQTTAWSYMGLKEKTQQMIACTLSILYTHILTSFTSTKNSRLYNISAIRTVAQNIILIYSNTFFSFTMYKLKLVTQKKKFKAQALKGHKSACYQVSWKPLEDKLERDCEWKLPASYSSFFHTPNRRVLQD